MRQDCLTDAEAVRRRLEERLDELGMSARKLALLTGDPEKNVQRYVKEGEKGTTTIPADFIGRCQAKGFASAAWLLTGQEPRDVVEPTAEQAAMREVVAIVDRLRSGGAVAEAIDDSLAVSRGSDATAEAQS